MHFSIEVTNGSELPLVNIGAIRSQLRIVNKGAIRSLYEMKFKKKCVEIRSEQRLNTSFLTCSTDIYRLFRDSIHGMR